MKMLPEPLKERITRNSFFWLISERFAKKICRIKWKYRLGSLLSDYNHIQITYKKLWLEIRFELIVQETLIYELKFHLFQERGKSIIIYVEYIIFFSANQFISFSQFRKKVLYYPLMHLANHINELSVILKNVNAFCKEHGRDQK